MNSQSEAGYLKGCAPFHERAVMSPWSSWDIQKEVKTADNAEIKGVHSGYSD